MTRRFLPKTLAIFIILASVVLIVFSGLIIGRSITNYYKSNQEIAQIKQERLFIDVPIYMENKYGEPFKYKSTDYGETPSTDSNGHYIEKGVYVTCESLPNENIYIEVNRDPTTNKVTYSDNYLIVRYKQEIIKFLEECAEEEFSEAIVGYTPSSSGLPDTLTPETTFDELLNNLNNPIVATIAVREASFQDLSQVEAFANRITSIHNIPFELTVIGVTDNSYAFIASDKSYFSTFINQEKYSHYAEISNVSGTIQTTWQ